MSWSPGWSELTVTPSPATSRASVLRNPVRPERGGVRQDQSGDRLAHGHRRDRDHPPPLLLAHRGHRGRAHRDVREAVELDRAAVRLERRAGEVAGGRPAAVAHEDVDAADRVLPRPGRTRPRPPPWRRRRPTAPPADRSRPQRHRCARGPAADRDGHALVGQRLGGGEAEPAGGGRDRGATSLDPEFIGEPSLVDGSRAVAQGGADPPGARSDDLGADATRRSPRGCGRRCRGRSGP